MGFFYDELKENINNKIIIAGSSQSGIQIEGILEHDVEFSGSSNWGNVASLSSSALDGLSDVIAVATGSSLSVKSQFNTRKKWEGSDSVSVTLQFTLIETSSKNPANVSQRAGQIFSYLYPSRSNKDSVADTLAQAKGALEATSAIAAANLLRTPQGYSPSGDKAGLLSLSIGTWFIAPSYWIITSVTPSIAKTIGTKTKMPTLSSISITLETYQMPLSSEIQSWFKGSNAPKTRGGSKNG